MPTAYDRAVEVKIDGEVLAQEKYRIGNVRLHQPMYAHHEFEIEVLGTETADALAALAGNADLEKLFGKIGAKIELAGGHGYLNQSRADTLEFTGVITAVEARTDYELGFAVILRGHSPTIRLDDVPRNKLFSRMKVSDWFSKVVGDRGLNAKVDATSETFEQLVQRGENDWQFALRVLGQAGLHVFYDGRELKALKKISGASYEMGYEIAATGLLEFSLRSTARPGKLKASVWSEGDAKKILQSSSASASTSAKASHGMTKQAESASGTLFGIEGNYVPALAPGSQSLLDQDAGSLRGAWFASLTRGYGRSDFFSLAPGVIVEMKGFGAGLGGKFVITSVTHTWSSERLEYENSFECIPELSVAPPRIARATPSHEVWTARVTSLKDPESLGRVEVKFLDFEEGQWVRLSSFYLNEAGGWVCYPEIGDEVIVSFVDGDDRYPVILGSVLHPKALGEAQKLVSAGLMDEKNDFKVFRTRSGLRLTFIETVDGQKIELASAAEEVLLRLDASADKVKFEIVSEGDVSITAKKTCTVTADEDVTVTTKGNFTVKADKDIVLESANFTQKAQQKNAIEGGMETEVKGGSGSFKAAASGVDIKGPMIKLN